MADLQRETEVIGARTVTETTGSGLGATVSTEEDEAMEEMDMREEENHAMLRPIIMVMAAGLIRMVW